MNIRLRIPGAALFASVVLLAFAPPAAAQVAVPVQQTGLAGTSTFGFGGGSPVNPIYQLVGQQYVVIDYGYVHRNSGSPRTMRSVGFVANEAAGSDYDTILTYDYLSGSAAGIDSHRHEVMYGMRPYLSKSWGKVFLQGTAGIDFSSGGTSSSTRAFAWSVAAGYEWESTNIALMPYLNYESVPKLHEYSLNAGVRVGLRLLAQVGAVFTAEIDKHGDFSIRGGIGYHY